MKKRMFLQAAVITAMLACVVAANAAPGSGALKDGLNAGYSELNGAMDIIKKIIYLIAAVMGLIGAVKVYLKFSEGAPDTTKTAAGWFGGAAFLVVAGIIIDNLFLK